MSTRLRWHLRKPQPRTNTTSYMDARRRSKPHQTVFPQVFPNYHSKEFRQSSTVHFSLSRDSQKAAKGDNSE